MPSSSTFHVLTVFSDIQAGVLVFSQRRAQRINQTLCLLLPTLKLRESSTKSRISRGITPTDVSHIDSLHVPKITAYSATVVLQLGPLYPIFVVWLTLRTEIVPNGVKVMCSLNTLSSRLKTRACGLGISTYIAVNMYMNSKFGQNTYEPNIISTDAY